MRILTATSHFFSQVKELFREDEEDFVGQMPSNFSGVETDLVVFTGGEDINPARYNKANSGILCFYNDSRDEREFAILQALLDGEIKTKKVLGICRGLQLLAVGQGASLVQDISTVYGEPHAHIHRLAHMGDHPLSFFKTVNSLHHQAVSRLTNCKPFPRILATHTKDGLPEIVVWDDTSLGVQFHPELMPNTNKDKWKFAETIRKWVAGEVKLSGKMSKADFEERIATNWGGTVRTDSMPFATTSRTFVNSAEAAARTMAELSGVVPEGEVEEFEDEFDDEFDDEESEE